MTWPLTFMASYKHFNWKWRVKLVLCQSCNSHVHRPFYQTITTMMAPNSLVQALQSINYKPQLTNSFVSYNIMLVLLVSHISLSSKWNDVISFVLLLLFNFVDHLVLSCVFNIYFRLFEICFHFAGHMSSTQEFSAGPSEFLPDLHFLCKIVLKPSNVIPLLLF